jgi:hypothetical protein
MIPPKRPARWFVILALLVAPPGAAWAADESEEELAKKVQNPVANLISVPFQNNFVFNTGPEKKTVWNLNFQPVIPISLNEKWNLITRTIVPVLNVPSLAPGLDHEFGMGDINPSLFLSPADSGKFIWGVGPTMTLPTASSRNLGAGKWSAGPTAVGLLMEGPWVVGALLNNQWSFAGWSDRDVNQFLVQPFLNYNFKGGWYLTSGPIMTSDWEAKSGQRWTVPVGGGGGKIVRLGKLPVNLSLQGFYNAVRPDYFANWSLRFQFQFLFPK